MIELSIQLLRHCAYVLHRVTKLDQLEHKASSLFGFDEQVWDARWGGVSGALIWCWFSVSGTKREVLVQSLIGRIGESTFVMISI